MSAEHDDHPKAAYDDINVRSISLVLGVGAILIFVAVVSVQVIYFRYSQNEYVQKVERVPTTEVNEYLAKQRKRLTVAGDGADPKKGEKSIPIAQAMKSVVAEYQQKKSAELSARVQAQDAEASDVAKRATSTEK